MSVKHYVFTSPCVMRTTHTHTRTHTHTHTRTHSHVYGIDFITKTFINV